MNPEILGLGLRAMMSVTFDAFHDADITCGPNPPRGKGKVMYVMPAPEDKRDMQAIHRKEAAKAERVKNRRKLGGRP